MCCRRLVSAVSVMIFALVLKLHPAGASEAYQIDDPVQRENLSIYLIRGNGNGGTAPVTLDQAAKQGAAKFHEQDDGSVIVENVSDRPIYVAFGTLLKGGLQDQVVGQDMILQPRSGPVSLPVYCVDPFRSTARAGEDAAAFAASGDLFPWLNARLSMLSGSETSKAIRAIRQSGVWWSIDTLRSRLSAKIGEALEPPFARSWTISDERELSSRHSSWTTSLALALDDEKLSQALQPYLDILSSPDADHANTIGAVFAINGRIVGADIYQSPQLFMSMWPNLIRSYSVEALALDTRTPETPPKASTVQAFLREAQQDGQPREGEQRRFSARENTTVISTGIADAGEVWTHRGYISKLEQPAGAETPDALVVKILESGWIADRPIASLKDGESFVVSDDNPEHRWSAAIVPEPTAFVSEPAEYNLLIVRLRQLHTAPFERLHLATTLSNQAPPTEGEGSPASPQLRYLSQTQRNGLVEFVPVALAAVAGFLSLLLGEIFSDYIWARRRNIMMLMAERTANAAAALAKSFAFLVWSAADVAVISYIGLQQLSIGACLKFRQLVLLGPILPPLSSVRVALCSAFIACVAPVIIFASFLHKSS
jgi:hypothetical protein